MAEVIANSGLRTLPLPRLLSLSSHFGAFDAVRLEPFREANKYTT
jgi:hypothetical protein